MIEVEVKIPIENIEKIKQKLLETGFIYQKTVVETDTYFTSDHYDMRKKDKALRIRKTENLDTGEVKAQLNCKGPKLDQVSMTRKETEIDIYEPEKMEDILKELEFYPASCRVEKTRGQRGRMPIFEVSKRAGIQNQTALQRPRRKCGAKSGLWGF